MKKIIWKNKFIFWNIIALLAIKAAFVYPTGQLLSLISGLEGFTNQDIIEQTNDFRQSNGAAPLRESSVLNQAALEKLQDMIDHQYFAHFSPAGVSPWHWLEVTKYKYQYAGENLALGFADATSTVQAWAQSPAHRQNMINGNFKEIGVAITQTKIGDVSGVVVVQLFGTPTQVVKPAVTPKPVATVRPVVVVTPVSSPLSTITLTPPKFRFQDVRVPEYVGNIFSEQTIHAVAAKAQAKINTVSRLVNRMFTVYSLLIVLVAIVFLGSSKINRQTIFKTLIYILISLAAILIPVLGINVGIIV